MLCDSKRGLKSLSSLQDPDNKLSGAPWGAVASRPVTLALSRRERDFHGAVAGYLIPPAEFHQQPQDFQVQPHKRH